jgi:hypothetical protein
MIETRTRDTKSRPVIRDSRIGLPSNWEIPTDSIAQYPVKIDSLEYKEIIALFNKTMANKYIDIVHLHRIRNKQWYMLYNTYTQSSQKKNTERRLFHGCSEESSQSIMKTFFNRIYAGTHGQSVLLLRMMNISLSFQVISMETALIFLPKRSTATVTLDLVH